jgi:hypothetical protein
MLSLKARILSIALIVAIIAWVFGEIYGSIEAWIAVSVCLALLLFHQ